MEKMREYLVPRTDRPPLRFIGECLGEVSSRKRYKNGDWAMHWCELVLYQTKAGKYICESIGRTALPHENEKNDAVVCETLDEVFAHFGSGWLSQKLYEEAGIEFHEMID